MTRKCSVEGCKEEGFTWRISLDAPNTTALNGLFCKTHYNHMLDIIRKLAVFSLRKRP